MYKSLKRIRIYVSLAFLALLSYAIIDTGFGISRLGRWLLESQIITAILASSVVWLVLWVIVTLWMGRLYCSTVCPLGTLQDCAAHLGRRLSRGPAGRYRYTPALDSVRIPIGLAVAGCLAVGLTTAVEATDPFTVYARALIAVLRPTAVGLGGFVVSMGVVLAVMAVAWRRGRLVCNTLCPAGSLLGLLGRQPVYRVDINTDKCIHCGRCEQVCKAECIDLRDCVVDNSRCVMCLNCTAVCPNDAITVRRGRHRLSIPMMQRTASALQSELQGAPDTETI